MISSNKCCGVLGIFLGATCWAGEPRVSVPDASKKPESQIINPVEVRTVEIYGRRVPTVHRRPSVVRGAAASAGTGGNNGDFADGLTAWTTTVLGGGASPGELRVENEQAVLLEGDSFLVTLSQSFVVQAPLVSLSFDLMFSPGFDRTDRFIPDAFEAQLLDDRARPVVPPWNRFATSFFNVQVALRTLERATLNRWHLAAYTFSSI